MLICIRFLACQAVAVGVAYGHGGHCQDLGTGRLYLRPVLLIRVSFVCTASLTQPSSQKPSGGSGMPPTMAASGSCAQVPAVGCTTPSTENAATHFLCCLHATLPTPLVAWRLWSLLLAATSALAQGLWPFLLTGRPSPSPDTLSLRIGAGSFFFDVLL